MITYKYFISEIERLSEEIDSLKNASGLHENENFRKWRSEIDGAFNQIAQAGYLLPCKVNIESRTFGQVENQTAENDMLKLYNMELMDTYNELMYIIKSFKENGEPIKSKKFGSAGLEYPEKITLSWLYHHSSFELWLKALTLLFATFIAGTQVGSSKLYNDLIKKDDARDTQSFKSTKAESIEQEKMSGSQKSDKTKSIITSIKRGDRFNSDRLRELLLNGNNDRDNWETIFDTAIPGWRNEIEEVMKVVNNTYPPTVLWQLANALYSSVLANKKVLMNIIKKETQTKIESEIIDRIIYNKKLNTTIWEESHKNVRMYISNVIEEKVRIDHHNLSWTQKNISLESYRDSHPLYISLMNIIKTTQIPLDN